MSNSISVVEMCEEFLTNYYRDEIGKLAQRYPKEQRSLVVDWMDVLNYKPALADDYLDKPEVIQDHMNEALRRVDLPVDVGFERARVRITNLTDERTFEVGEYLPQHIGEALAVRGQVSQVSPAKPELVHGVFECQNCGTFNEVPQNEGSEELQDPRECIGCERKGPFRLDIKQSTLQDSQLIRVQQPPEMTRDAGSHLDIKLKDDLASADIYGGERVSTSGVLSIDEEDLEKSTFDYYLRGEDVDVEDGSYKDIDPEEYREEIDEIKAADDPVEVLVDNFAPHLSRDGKLNQIIEALILQMVGTSRKSPDGGATKRGDSHMLLLGDPGTSKSELLEEVETLSPRAKLKSGEGITKAGVTAAATKDDFGPTQWSVKAGLMVLASGGIACLDEMDKADDSALESMHQALENQRVTISKAGIDAEMPSQTALLAAGNPKHGRFDQYEPVTEQIDLSAPLMSRFDLMFMVHDEIDEERDSEIAEKIIDSWSEAGLMEHTKRDVESTSARDICEDQERAVEAFRAYIAEAKQQIDPIIVDEAVKNKLRDEYLNIRLEGADEDSPVPVTARKLEAFLRLAESSARARFSKEVEIQDVDRASELVLASLEDVGIDPETGQFDADMVNTGTSKSQRDRMKNLKQIISELESEHEEGAPLKEIVKRATELDIGADKTERELEKLRTKGEIYEHNENHYRVT
jgi:replicative DNA helicase Mcm